MRNRRSDIEITTTEVAMQPVTILHVAFYGVKPDDLRLEGIMDALADEVLNTGLPHPDITRESHSVPVRSPV
jgi:hypothetical protein